MSPQRERGVTLIEALVALVVMAFGTLAAVGMQSMLRLNADVARQRAEAVRLAQDAIEDRRAFVKLDSGAATRYADILSSAPSTIAGLNASYVRTETVVSSVDPRVKSLQVAVQWTDRAGQTQRIALATAIAGIEPELAASLAIPMDLTLIRNPQARHADIPPSAVDLGDGSSRFEPPPAGALGWIFDNRSGLITRTCSGTVCVDARARLLAGFVRFATGSLQPTGVQAETPGSPALPVAIAVQQTAPSAGVVACQTQPMVSHVAYFCALPVAAQAPRWSGRAQIAGLAWAAHRAEVDATRYRVCRYTPQRAHLAAPISMKNEDHPLDYVNVERGLTQQNYLVIRAGDGSAAFDCPDDDLATPFVRGTTWHHQPAL